MMRGLFAAILLFVATATSARPNDWAQPIDRQSLPNLHRVSATIYRSAQPRDDAQQALTELGIKSVISNVRRIHAPIESWDVDHNEVMRALRALIDPANQPVLVHCRHGADRTGTIAAVFRMVDQGWTHAAALDELLNGGYGFQTLWRNIPRYVETVDIAALRRRI